MRNGEIKEEIRLKSDSESDHVRLRRADMAIDVARCELEALENNCEDLNYLIEIVQVGLRRALEAAKSKEEIIFNLPSSTPTRPN